MADNFTNSFLSVSEKKISKKFLEDGYFIGEAANQESLEIIRSEFIKIISNELEFDDKLVDENLFDFIHKKVPVSELNEFRLNVIQKINNFPELRKHYFNLARPYLETLVGSELAMQVKVNLSIQYPNDDSSLLPTHADTWSGDSPFEVVVWVPLVDCYRTKSMYILPPKENLKLDEDFQKLSGGKSENLFKSIKDKVKWLEVKYGEVLIFNLGLPHGNRVNLESESRWSMNCRFKGVFTPYWNKSLGSFFEPITLKPASHIGMNYKLPELK